VVVRLAVRVVAAARVLRARAEHPAEVAAVGVAGAVAAEEAGDKDDSAHRNNFFQEYEI